MTDKLSERLERIARGQVWGSGDLNALEAAIELAERVEGAEVAYVEPKNGLAVMHERCLPLAMIGQRVRIVPEAGKGEP